MILFLWIASGPLAAQSSHSPQNEVLFGINSFLGNLQHSEVRSPTAKTAAVDRTNYLDAAQNLSVTTIRETFMNWAEIEPMPNSGYKFDDFDDIVRKASARHIEIVALLYPFPPWATGNHPTVPKGDYVFLGYLPLRSFEDRFTRFVRTTVARYCGCADTSLKLDIPIHSWIFFNEPDATHVDTAEYAYWLKIFYTEVKSVDPSARIIAPALATAGLAFGNLGLDKLKPSFLAELLSSQELQGPNYPYFDIVDFHSYPVFYGSETGLYSMNAEYGYVRRVLNVHKIRSEIWLTETGDNSPDYAAQADHDVKLVVHAASLGVKRVYLHGLWDYAAPELWGVLENTPTGSVPIRKPSFYAYRTLVKKLAGNYGVEFLGPGHYRASFSGHHEVYILWADGPNSVPLPLFNGRVLVSDVNGKTETIRATDLQLASHPVFVEQVE